MLPGKEKDRFLEALEANSGAAQDAFAHIDVNKAEAHDPDDKARIMYEVEQIGGAAKVNEAVISAMNGAVADVNEGILRPVQIIC